MIEPGSGVSPDTSIMVTCALPSSDTVVSWLFEPLLTKTVKFKMPEEYQGFLLCLYETQYHPFPRVTYLTVGSIQQSLDLQWDCKKRSIFSSQKTTDLLKKYNSLQDWLHRSLVWDLAPTPLPPRNPLAGWRML